MRADGLFHTIEWTRSGSAAARTTRRSATRVSRLGGGTFLLDSPVPRRSCSMSRPTAAASGNRTASMGSPHSMSTRCEKVELPHHIWRTLAGDLVGNVDTVGCLRVASLGYHGEKSLPAKVSQQGWSPTTQSALLEHPQDRAFGELL